MSDQKKPITIELSDGRKAVVEIGKGKHGKQAMQQCEGDQSKYLSILMAALVTIDGKGIVPEDLDEILLSDYTNIQKAFVDINF